MLPTDQGRFCELVTDALRAYSKRPTEQDLEDWWHECRGLTIDALQSALKAHKEDPDRGERAPRPADITRRMKVGNRDAQRCAARDVSAQCAYPGIFSEATQGGERWFCPLHRMDHEGPEASRRITYSHEVPWAEFRAKQIAKRQAESARASGVTETAHAIALRHGDRPWQGTAAALLAAFNRSDEAA